jgi:hypothetical protein
MTARTHGALVLSLVIGCGVACSEGGMDDGDPLERVDGGDTTLSGLAIEPASVTLNVDLATTTLPTQSYKAFANIDGQRTEVTDRCTFSVTPDLATIAGTLLTAGARGGKGQVTAQCAASSASSELTINVRGSVVIGDAPKDAKATFDAATVTTDAARTSKIEYPLDFAVAPQNFPPIEAQWTSAGNDLFHLSVTSKYLTLDFYVAAPELTIPSEHWAKLMSSTTPQDLNFRVEALKIAEPTKKFVSEPIKLHVTVDRIEESAIYFWSASKQAMMTSTFGSLELPTEVKGDCTACHSLSRSGRRAFYSRSDCKRNPDGTPMLDSMGACAAGTVMGGFMKWDTASKSWVETLAAKSGKFEMSYGTFVPNVGEYADDKKSLLVASPAYTGPLELYDPDSATIVPSNIKDASSAGGTNGLMPDWSPDGKTIVFAGSTAAPAWCASFTKMQLMTMGYDNSTGSHVFSAAKPLLTDSWTLPSGTYDNFFFPSFDPSGQYIVFNGAKGNWLNQNPDGALKADPRIMLTDAKGSFKNELNALNGTDSLDNTWPHWAPTAGKDYLFVVFSTERPYGHRVTKATRPADWSWAWMQQYKQLWVAAIDKKKIGTGDPSAPPMWLPGQDPKHHNLSPFWTRPTSGIK